MRRRAAVGLALLASLALAACQGAPPPVPKASSPDASALAAQALERGDYAKAAELYRQALRKSPDSLPLHYGLGVAASYLSQKDEAIREFRWVLERGAPGSTEVATARRWLASVGALPRSVALARQQEEERRPGTAGLEGRAVFAQSGKQPAPMSRLQLFLVGQPNSPTKEERHVLRTDESGYFRFRNLVPGPYMLTNRRAGQPIWRLKVQLEPGKDTVLDLSPSNSVAARDDFPETR